MKLKQALAQARTLLLENDIEETSLESEVLLRHTLNISRPQLYLDLDRELGLAQEAVFQSLLERRLWGEPSAYITGHREFYGLDFHVDRRVLIPRPESELLVEKAINLCRHPAIATIADIGTGCGALAVSLAVNLPGVRIYATDVSAPALEVARLNCRRHRVADRVCLLEGDMLEPLPEPVDLIVANMPYVRESEVPQRGPLSYEPALALNGGPDGTAGIRRLCSRLSDKLRPGGWLLLEIGQGQREDVVALLGRLFPAAEVDVASDFSGIERMVSLHLTPGRL